MLNFAFPFLILSGAACGKFPEQIPSKPTAQISPTIQNTLPPQPAPEIKSLIDFFSLANKSAAEIETVYGKPSFIDTKSIQLKDEAGECRLYDKTGKRFLQIDYFKGKAVDFY